MSDENENTTEIEYPLPETPYKPMPHYDSTLRVVTSLGVLLAAIPNLEVLAADLRLQAEDDEKYRGTAALVDACHEASMLLAEWFPADSVEVTREIMIEDGPAGFAVYSMMREYPEATAEAIERILWGLMSYSMGGESDET